MDRTSLFKQQASFSLVYKSVDIFISFLLVRLFLDYFDYESYGIWMILFSIVSYFRFLNLGLDQGLRNILTELLAKKNKKLAREYISTVYIFLFIISLIFYFIFLILNQYINWQLIFNSSLYSKQEFIMLTSIIFLSFLLTLSLKIIITVLVAHQKTSFINLFHMIEKFFQLIYLLFLINFFSNSILLVGLGFSLIPLIILLFITFYYFKKNYNHLRPGIKYFNYACIRPSFNLGIKFFIINLSVIILFSTDNLIITQLLGPKSVVSYQIIAKYFNIPILLFMLIAQPLWSSVTDAYTKKDFSWIKNTVKKLEKVSFYFVVMIILMFFMSDYIFTFWLNDKNIIFSFSLKFLWALFSILFILNMIYTYAINGMGKIKLQLYVSLFSSIINIPLSIIFVSYFGLESSGVILATIISILIYIPYKYIQYNRLVNETAIGLWNE